jgi:hypothetical protein
MTGRAALAMSEPGGRPSEGQSLPLGRANTRTAGAGTRARKE